MTRQVDWNEVGEAYWITFCSAMAIHQKGEPPEFNELPKAHQEAIIAGCKEVFKLACEES